MVKGVLCNVGLRLLILIVLSQAFFSCNFLGDQIREGGSITMEMTIANDDVFEVYFTDDKLGGYSNANRLQVPVIGGEEPQAILFSFPLSGFPEKFRIDIGKSGANKILTIMEMKIKYGSFELIIPKEHIHRYFKINQYIDYDSQKGELRCNYINGKFDPFIEVGPLLDKRFAIENF